MIAIETVIGTFVLLWTVIDPIGTIPVFISATRGQTIEERKKVARIAAITAGGILLFFIVVGEIALRAMGGPSARIPNFRRHHLVFICTENGVR